ncbi:MAG: hypothetical protein ACUVSC_07430 [Candidatus Fervidibacter sp.]|uniref:hypothetical protein n=1 Tax=Candidatus Fervidibacter sp. TaxID=3100871 RepID=UPI00404A081D
MRTSMRLRRLLSTVAVTFGVLLSTTLTSPAPFQPGNIFIAYDGNKIGVFANTVLLSGSQVSTLILSFGSFTTGKDLSGGGGIALDELGNLYVTLGNKGLAKFDVNGNSVFWRNYSISEVDDFRSIAVRDGKIYVATDNGIRVFRASDGERIPSEDFGTYAFRDVVFDNQGNLYALRESPTGTVRVHFWSKGAGAFTGNGEELFFASGNADPRTIVVGDDGNIYITVNPSGGPFVRKFTRKGDLLATYNVPSGTGKLIGLGYDPGTQRLFASHTGTGIGQILWIDKMPPVAQL